jgi:hypothetical protein
VIACGAVGTPQVLFNSNIRPLALGKYLTEQSLTFCQVSRLFIIINATLPQLKLCLQIVLKRSLIDSIPKKYPEMYKKHHDKNLIDPLPIPFNDPEPQVTMPYAPNTPYHVQIHRDAFAYGGVGPRYVYYLVWLIGHSIEATNLSGRIQGEPNRLCASLITIIWVQKGLWSIYAFSGSKISIPTTALRLPISISKTVWTPTRMDMACPKLQ